MTTRRVWWVPLLVACSAGGEAGRTPADLGASTSQDASPRGRDGDSPHPTRHDARSGDAAVLVDGRADAPDGPRGADARLHMDAMPAVDDAAPPQSPDGPAPRPPVDAAPPDAAAPLPPDAAAPLPPDAAAPPPPDAAAPLPPDAAAPPPPADAAPSDAIPTPAPDAAGSLPAPPRELPPDWVAPYSAPAPVAVPDPPPNGADQLPRDPDGTAVISASDDGSELRQDPALRDPVTALGVCADLVGYCVAPPERTLDACVASARVCETDRPWEEAQPCCPAACRDGYAAARLAGARPIPAFEQIFFGGRTCFPGVAELMEATP